MKEEGFQAALRPDGRSGLAEAKRWKPDVVILDLVLPKLGGLDVCSAMRREPKLHATAIIVLSGRGDEIDRVTCLEVGADDFVVKPFSLRELVARVRALVRRWERATSPEAPLEPLQVGDLVIDPEAQAVTQGGVTVHMTPIEFRFLHLLASKAGRVVSREELMKAVWGKHRNVTTHSLDIYFGRLRDKLESDRSQPARLKTVRGVGFMYTKEEQPATRVVPLRAKGVSG